MQLLCLESQLIGLFTSSQGLPCHTVANYSLLANIGSEVVALYLGILEWGVHLVPVFSWPNCDIDSPLNNTEFLPSTPLPPPSPTTHPFKSALHFHHFKGE